MDAAHQRQTEPGATADGGACSFVGVLGSLLPPRQQLGVSRDKRRTDYRSRSGHCSLLTDCSLPIDNIVLAQGSSIGGLQPQA